MADVDVDDKQARHNIRQMWDRADNFKSVFRWAQRELEKANRENFASQGTASGKPWMPLDNEYARWKLANHGALPILVVSGTLKDSLTRLRGAPNEIDKKSAVFGTNLTVGGRPIARYHQDGTTKMPARKIVFVPPMFAASLAQKVGAHIVYGDLGRVTASTPLLKGQF